MTRLEYLARCREEGRIPMRFRTKPKAEPEITARPAENAERRIVFSGRGASIHNQIRVDLGGRVLPAPTSDEQ